MVSANDFLMGVFKFGKADYNELGYYAFIGIGIILFSQVFFSQNVSSKKPSTATSSNSESHAQSVDISPKVPIANEGEFFLL